MAKLKDNDVFKLIVDGINSWESKNPQKNIEQEFGMPKKDILENLYKIAFIESSFDPNIVGDTHLDNKSYGLFQINEINESMLGNFDIIFQPGNEIGQVEAAIDLAVVQPSNPYEPWTAYLLQNYDGERTFQFARGSDKPTDAELQTAQDKWAEAGAGLENITLPRKGVYAEYFPTPEGTNVDDNGNETGTATSPIGPNFDQTFSPKPSDTPDWFTRKQESMRDAPAPAKVGSAGIVSPTVETKGPVVWKGEVFGFDGNGNIVPKNDGDNIKNLISNDPEARRDIMANIMRVSGYPQDIWDKYRGTPVFDHAATNFNFYTIPSPSGAYSPIETINAQDNSAWVAEGNTLVGIETKEMSTLFMGLPSIPDFFSLDTDGNFAMVRTGSPRSGETNAYIAETHKALWNKVAGKLLSNDYEINQVSGSNLWQLTNLNNREDVTVYNSNGTLATQSDIDNVNKEMMWVDPINPANFAYGNKTNAGPNMVPAETWRINEQFKINEEQRIIDNDLKIAKAKASEFYNAANLAREAQDDDNGNVLEAFAQEETARANDLNALNELQKEQRYALENIFKAMQSPADVLAASFALTGDESPLGELTMADKVNRFVNNYVQMASTVKSRLDRSRTYEDIMKEVEPSSKHVYTPPAYFRDVPTAPAAPATAAPVPAEAAPTPTDKLYPDLLPSDDDAPQESASVTPDTLPGDDEAPPESDSAPPVEAPRFFPGGDEETTPEVATTDQFGNVLDVSDQNKLNILGDDDVSVDYDARRSSKLGRDAYETAMGWNKIDHPWWMPFKHLQDKEIAPYSETLGYSPKDLFAYLGGFNPKALHMSAPYQQGMNISNLTSGMFTNPSSYNAARLSAIRRFNETGLDTTVGSFDADSQTYDWQDKYPGGVAASPTPDTSEYWVPENNKGGVNLGNPIIVGDSKDGSENEELVLSQNGAPMVVLPLDANQQRIMQNANRFIPRAQEGYPRENPQDNVGLGYLPAGAEESGITGHRLTIAGNVAQGQPIFNDPANPAQPQYWGQDFSDTKPTEIPRDFNPFAGMTGTQFYTDAQGNQQQYANYIASLNPNDPRNTGPAGPAPTRPTTPRGTYSTADYDIGGKTRKPTAPQGRDLFSLPGFSGNITQKQIQDRSDFLTPPRAAAVTTGGLRTSPQGGYRFLPSQQTRFGALGPQFAMPTPGYLSSLSENERAFLKSNLATRNVFLRDVEQDAVRRFGKTGARTGKRRFG